MSLAGNGHDDGAASGFDVAFQMENLLPGAQDRFSTGHRHGQGRSQQRGLQMRVAVAVVPGAFVSVIAAGRDEFVQQVRQVFHQARFKFDGARRAINGRVRRVLRCRVSESGLVSFRLWRAFCSRMDLCFYQSPVRAAIGGCAELG